MNTPSHTSLLGDIRLTPFALTLDAMHPADRRFHLQGATLCMKKKQHFTNNLGDFQTIGRGGYLCSQKLNPIRPRNQNASDLVAPVANNPFLRSNLVWVDVGRT